MMKSESRIMYRYDGYQHLVADEYIVVEETPCGYWINHPSYLNKPQFIRKGARKSFAYPTKELAIRSYIKRKEWQIMHLERQLANAKEGRRQAKDGLVEDKAIWKEAIRKEAILPPIDFDGI